MPGMCSGAVFLRKDRGKLRVTVHWYIPRGVFTENGVTDNKLRDLSEFPLYLSIKCGMIKDRR